MSKGLEDLKWLIENGYLQLQSWQEDVVAVDCVDNIEKELKALEIIKETFKISFNDEELIIGIDDVYFLTFKDKTKYDLLKEVVS